MVFLFPVSVFLFTSHYHERGHKPTRTYNHDMFANVYDARKSEGHITFGNFLWISRPSIADFIFSLAL